MRWFGTFTAVLGALCVNDAQRMSPYERMLVAESWERLRWSAWRLWVEVAPAAAPAWVWLVALAVVLVVLLASGVQRAQEAYVAGVGAVARASTARHPGTKR